MSNPTFLEYQNRGPGRGWYVLAAVVAVAGVAAAVWVAYQGAAPLGGDESWQKVTVPGEHTLTFARPGRYDIFREVRTLPDGSSDPPPGVAARLACTLTARDGRPVALTPPGVNTTYSIRGRTGMAFLTFRIDEPGEYSFSARYPAGHPEVPMTLTIARDLRRRLLRTALATAGLALGGLGLAGAIIAVTAIRRYKARQAAVPPNPT